MTYELTTVKDRLQHIPENRYPEVGRLLVHFMDTVASATPRATFYNDRNELMRAAGEVHDELFKIDRGLYGLLLGIQGATDWSRQVGIANLLANARDSEPAFLNLHQETQLIHYLSNKLPITRRLKLFGILRRMRVNNSRTRHLIFESIANDPNLEFRALKYKNKMRDALIHALGQRTASILKSIYQKQFADWTEKEKEIVSDALPVEMNGDVLAFLLGVSDLESPRLKAYFKANEDPDYLKELPPEVAEGKRSTFHPDLEPDKVLELTKDKMTAGQEITLQRSAKKKGVELEFDPMKHDAFRLFVYAYENGMTDEIADALGLKAEQAAEKLPMNFGKVATIVDTSQSMFGDKTQKNRPISVAMATAGMLSFSAVDHQEFMDSFDRDLPIPSGHTDLAKHLVDAFRFEPDAVFVITDGYENAPAGRFAEVLSLARKMGVETPVYQITPTFSAEAYGVKELAPDIQVLPVGPNIGSLGIGMMRAMLESDFIRGITALINTVAPLALPERSGS